MERQERREQPRSNLAMPARLRKMTYSQPAIVRDLSTTGCRLEFSGFALEPENRVLIRPHGLESLLGAVVWSHEGQAGVKFDEPLKQAEVDRYCQRFPEPEITILLDIAA